MPHITAHPSPSNLLEWHFVLEGAKGTDYESGYYHGKLQFPPHYPFKPPSVLLVTPNGRFAVNTKLCLSMTDFHPESWNPMWSVGTILNGLLSFMYDSQPTTGSITSTSAEKQKLAKESLAFNAKNPTFRKLFPDLVEQHSKRLEEASKQAEAQGGAGNGDGAVARDGAADGAASAAGASGAGGPPPSGQNSLITIAIVVVVLAIAVVPLFSSRGSPHLAGWLGGGAGSSRSTFGNS